MAATEQASDGKINTEKSYVLGRDVKATVRLHVQHHYVGETQGFQLDPVLLDKYAHKTKDDKIMIADAGTGTGHTSIWAAGVARTIGDRCIVDGYDISAAQFPHHTCLPAQVKLEGDVDLFADLPEHMLDKYDIVHARFFTLVIRHDALPLIQNLYRMCSPGGWVQLTEAHMDEHWIIYPDGIKPESTLQGTQGVLDGFRNFLNIMGIGGDSFAWQRTLDQTFQKAGFINYEFIVYRAPEPEAAYNSDQLLVLGEELARGALAMGKARGADEDAARKLLAASEAGKEESLRGIHMNWTLFSIRAQRPVQS